MAQQLAREEVLRVAALARLALSDDEIDRFARQLSDILAYAEAVQQVETTGVTPMTQALAGVGAWREDRPVPALGTAAALRNAPAADQDAGLFKVPKVL
jgi:aspartyl-tRNA(Asn)/glutamyl-tRNA(Gln) amidotransferase subunit C